jgi:peptidoglycan/xylan/chitin deacetylase (PgdA/CDA1 family)
LAHATATSALNLAYKLGAFRALGIVYAGCGLIFSMHRVVEPGQFALHPVHKLRSDILHDILTEVRNLGWEIVSIQQVRERLMLEQSSNQATHRRHYRFACFTLDDGYADNLTVALPIFRKHAAPICVYIATGIVERSIFYWWGANEELVLRNDRIELPSFGDSPATVLWARTWEEKQATYYALDELCHRGGESFIPIVRELYQQYRVDPERCLNCDALTISQVRELAADPLVTIGSHGVTHRRLLSMTDDEVRFELEEGRRRLEDWSELEVRHLAYPFGRSDACGAREFEAARQAGFDTAVTTRQGNIFPAHCDYLRCLPRRSIPVSRFGLRNALFGIETIIRNDSRIQIS